jgi:hypothetical protein
MFDNRELRRIFGPTREKVTGGWRKFHNEKFILCTFIKYYYRNKIKTIEMGGRCSTH